MTGSGEREEGEKKGLHYLWIINRPTHITQFTNSLKSAGSEVCGAKGKTEAAMDLHTTFIRTHKSTK